MELAMAAYHSSPASLSYIRQTPVWLHSHTPSCPQASALKPEALGSFPSFSWETFLHPNTAVPLSNGLELCVIPGRAVIQLAMLFIHLF